MTRGILWLIIITGLLNVSLVVMAETPAAPIAKPSAAKTTNPLAYFDLGKYQYCGSDADCIKANNGCCDCANGGKDVAVNKQHLKDFEAQFDCLHVACTMMAAVPPCGSGVVSCVDHKCKYIEFDEATR